MNSIFPAELPKNSTTDQQRPDIGASVLFPHTIIVFMLEDEIQNPGEFLYRFSIGSDVVDQSSGDDRFDG